MKCGNIHTQLLASAVIDATSPIGTCEVLEVSTSGYFEHWRRKDADKPSRPGVNKRISDEALLVYIKAIHVEVKQEYG